MEKLKETIRLRTYEDGDNLEGFLKRLIIDEEKTYSDIVLRESWLLDRIFWSDVKAFGAVGDGVTNDSVAIQAAIDSLTTGIVFFPKGTFLTDAITGKSNVWLAGMGRGISILKQKTAGTTIFTLGTGKSNVRINDLEFDGDDLGTTYGGYTGTDDKAIEIVESSNVYIQRCYIHNFTNQGIYINLGDGSPQTDEIYIEDNEIADIGLRNSSIDTPYGSGQIPGGGAWICLAVGAGNSQTSYGKNIYIRRNKIHGSLNTLISFVATDYGYIEDNEVYDTDSNSIQVGTYARYGKIRNNHLHTFTGLFDPTTEGHGISIHHASGQGDENALIETDFVIEGNRIFDATRYGINTLSANNCIIKNNRIIDNAQSSNRTDAAIFARGNYTVIENNFIDNPNFHGIYVQVDGANKTGIQIIDNIILSADDHALVCTRVGGYTGSYFTVSRNFIYNPQKAGILLGACLHGKFNHNHIIGANQVAGANDAMSLYYNTSGETIGNYIVGGSDVVYGINLNDSGVVHVADNVIPDFATAPYRTVSGTITRKENIKIGTITAATNDERPVFLTEGNTGSFIVDILVVNASDITQNDTDYETFDVQDKGADGTGTTSLFATNPTTKATGGLDINAFAAVSLSPDQNRAIPKGRVVSFKKTKTGSGQGLDEMILNMKYLNY